MPNKILIAADARNATEAELVAFFKSGSWNETNDFVRAAAAKRLAKLRGVLNRKRLAELEFGACTEMLGFGLRLARTRPATLRRLAAGSGR